MVEKVKFVINRIKSHAYLLLLFAIVFVLAFIAGIAFNKNGNNVILYDAVANYCYCLYSCEGSVMAYLLPKYFSFVMIIGLLSLCAYNGFLIFFGYIIVALKAFVLGALSVIFFNVYNIGGAFIFLFAVLPCTLLFCTGACVMSILSYDDSQCVGSIRNIDFKCALNNFAIGVFFILCAFLIEFLLTSVVIRPLSLLV